MRMHRINLRLTGEELEALRRYAGKSDSERVRSMLHTHVLADAISEPIENRINTLETEQRANKDEISALRDTIETANQKMREAAQTMHSLYNFMNE